MRANGRTGLFLPLVMAFFGVGCGQPTAPPVTAIEPEETMETLTSQTPQFENTDYPVWRNVDQDGVETARDVPIEWSENENVAWSREVPGEGHSSPIICDSRVYVTTADENEQTQSILAFDKESGEPLWQQVAHEKGLMRAHSKNSHASATPACDGERVYAAFINSGALYVTAYEVEGTRVWQQQVGTFDSEHGYGSSVLLWQGMIFVSGDSRGNGFVAALSRDDGKVIWRTPRPGVGRHGNYATPIVTELAGEPQLILAGFEKVVSYDPASGKERWRCDGPTEVMANAIAYKDPYVFVSGGYPDKEILCIKTDGEGDISDTHVAWHATRNVAYVPSPTIVDDNLYIVTDDGIIACYSANEGELLWQKRLGGNFSASPLVIGKRFYLPDESGDVFVFDVEPKYKLLAKNRLDSKGGMASLTVSGEKLFVRTKQKLYCIAKDEA